MENEAKKEFLGFGELTELEIPTTDEVVIFAATLACAS
jgi:hypothetical protein